MVQVIFVLSAASDDKDEVSRTRCYVSNGLRMMTRMDMVLRCKKIANRSIPTLVVWCKTIVADRSKVMADPKQRAGLTAKADPKQRADQRSKVGLKVMAGWRAKVDLRL